jgi:hypothetical protein
MFPSWRLKILDAKRALAAGRWDEAGLLLQRDSVREFLPAKRLSQEVAARLADRSRQRLSAGESSAGWQDLRLAAQLGGNDQQLAELRQAYARRGLDRIRTYLVQGETALASDQIAKLEQRRLGGEERRRWKLIVELIARAKEASRIGNATAASEILERARLLLSDPHDPLAEQITSRQAQLRQDAVQIDQLASQLHEAVSGQVWTTVLPLAVALLELAPEHASARRARRLAWQAVGMDATRTYRPTPELLARGRNAAHLNGMNGKSTRKGASSEEADTMTAHELGKRQLAWIDGVGGFLICLSDEVTLGQPSDPTSVEIPLRADISRRHATLRRESEAYVLTPIHEVSVNSRPLSGPTVLQNNDLIELGDSVRLRFRKPHALSATAVLTVESHHKTEPAVDAIVLMSDSCILGPQRHSHICCRNWVDELVLFRRGEGLGFRTSATVEVDGQPAKENAILPGICRLEAENFAMSFEDL